LDIEAVHSAGKGHCRHRIGPNEAKKSQRQERTGLNSFRRTCKLYRVRKPKSSNSSRREEDRRCALRKTGRPQGVPECTTRETRLIPCGCGGGVGGGGGEKRIGGKTSASGKESLEKTGSLVFSQANRRLAHPQGKKKKREATARVTLLAAKRRKNLQAKGKR